MSMEQRINDVNARSRRVSPILFKAAIAWFLGAIVLAMLAPALSARGLHLQRWMVWTVMLGSFALSIGPDLWRRHVRNRPRRP
ncbi:MAG TPA: hypothetical protein VNJ03_11995 [Vicinamibacterales bacterium]|nr:hypothetical protein [Vicinamibacterales bacterium]